MPGWAAAPEYLHLFSAASIVLCFCSVLVITMMMMCMECVHGTVAVGHDTVLQP